RSKRGRGNRRPVTLRDDDDYRRHRAGDHIEPGGAETGPRGHRSLVLHRISIGGLYALLVWAPLAFGAHEGRPLAIPESLALLGYMGGGSSLVWLWERPKQDRVAATFVNPDHFAAWLAMLVCLGLGYLGARKRRRGRFSPLDLLEREARERLLRRYIPALGVG